MSLPILVSIAVLAAIFLIATLRPVNLGALALIGTFGVGILLVGEDLKATLAGFPADVFVLLVGVTYLFGIAAVNGTIEWLVNGTARLVRQNRLVIPWMLFFLAAIPTTIGAAGPASVALLSPFALRLAKKHGINPRLAGAMVVNGSNAGNFSPLNVLGVIVNGTISRNGLEASALWIWLGNFGFTVLLGIAAFVVFGGRQLIRDRRTEKPVADESVTEEKSVGRVPLVATLAAIVLVAVGALALRFDIGVLALTAAILLHLFLPESSKGAVAKISWSTVLLICGVVTYVALMQRIGAVKAIGGAVAGVAAPLIAILLLCLIAALTSAFASSIGILGAMIPLAVPFLATGSVSVTGAALAIAISATAVDAVPFSSLGAVAVASAPDPDREALYRGLIRWGFAMVPVVPAATWLLFVVL